MVVQCGSLGQLADRVNDIALLASPSPSSSDEVSDTPTRSLSYVSSYSTVPNPQSESSREVQRDYYEDIHRLSLALRGPGIRTERRIPFANLAMIARLSEMPNEVLYHILGFLDVNDLLSMSRTSHHLRSLSLAPILRLHRLRYSRVVLPPLLSARPSLADLIARSIFLTNTSVVSRRLGRSLVSIRLSRRLAARPSAEKLAERAVLPPECVPGLATVHIAPGLVAKRRAIEKEKMKDELRKWVDAVWKGKVIQKEEGVRRWEQKRGIGRVWRLRRFWERIGRGESASVR